MTLELPAILREARAAWRSDRAILWPLSGLSIFLPQYAVLLLIPAMPASPAGASVEAWSKALEPWVASYGGWYVLATVLAQYGVLATVALYAAPRANVGAAMVRALRLFPRALLAGVLVTMPCGAAALASLSVPFAPLFVLPGIVYVLARASLVAPVLAGEQGRSAVAAIARSWALTRGRGLPVMLLVGGIMLAGQAIGGMLIAVDRGVRADALANPVLIAMVDALAAGAAWAAALALALVEVALYRRLASSFRLP